jgi:uncharacterized protein YgiM (DUF1202 family)
MTSPKNPKVVLTVKKGETVVVEGCDPKGHCRIVTKNKKRGWFRIDQVGNVAALKLELHQVFGEFEAVE